MYLLGEPTDHEDEADYHREEQESALGNSKAIQPVHLVIELGNLFGISAVGQTVASQNYN